MKFGKHELTIIKRAIQNSQFWIAVLPIFVIRIITQNSLICQYNSVFQSLLEKEVKAVSEIKERMASLGISQVDMILELQKRGYAVQPPMMSSILRGVYTYPKAKQILTECENILNERERELNPV